MGRTRFSVTAPRDKVMNTWYSVDRMKWAYLKVHQKKMSAEPPSKKHKAEEDGPPRSSTLEELACGSTANLKRYEAVVAAFEKRYGCKPAFLCRAPGRVNIIGEHIDYSGYGVLPMALEQDVAIASKPNTDGIIRFVNLNPNYPDHSCPVEGFSIDKEDIKWYNYILCGVKGMLEYLNIESPVGMDLVVEGSVPPAAGLSSSSAVVCCSALTTICNNKVALPSRNELARLCAKCERFIGTEGGGMDQAISYLGESGKAFMIEFNPIRASEVQLPEGFSFVISNTLVSSNKAAESFYNIRVSECRVAAKVIAKEKGLDWKNVNKLGELADSLKMSCSEMVKVVEDCLHEGSYSLEEIAQILEVDTNFVTECVNRKARDVKVFKLRDRACHVYIEADHVYKFKATSECGRGEDTAVELGKLMDASHESCRKKYECSCDKLDEVVGLAKEAGALGSRLTGAGWGGSAVSLVRTENVQCFLRKLEEEYYKKKNKMDEVSNSLFATTPGAGAAFCQL